MLRSSSRPSKSGAPGDDPIRQCASAIATPILFGNMGVTLREASEPRASKYQAIFTQGSVAFVSHVHRTRISKVPSVRFSADASV
jgi:hypothetical protein